MAEPYKQRRHGVDGWELRVQVRGQRSRLWAPTKKKLESLVEDLEDKRQRTGKGFRAPKAILTYDQLCERMLKLYPSRERSRQSLEWDLAYSRKAFGKLTLFDIELEDVEEWMLTLRGLKGGELKPYTKRHALKAMRQALNWAIGRGYVDINVATFVKSPDVVDRPDPFDSWDEVFKVARAFEYKPYGRAVRFAAGMGLRPQEWQVLRERDVDRKAGTLTISRTWASGETELTKTEHSRATIYLSDIALEVLDELPRGLPDALLFPSISGGIISLGNWRSREWTDALTKAKVTYRPPRQLRHTFATLALKAGVPLEDVSRMLRHDSVRTTERFYLEIVPQVKRRSAEKLSAEMPRFEAKTARKA